MYNFRSKVIIYNTSLKIIENYNLFKNNRKGKSDLNLIE